MAAIVRAEHGDSESDDEDEDNLPGFYYPADYVLITWQEKRDKGILPEPGGLNDQDWRLVYHDWPLLNERYNRLAAQLYPDEGEGEQYTPYTVPPQRQNISGLME